MFIHHNIVLFNDYLNVNCHVHFKQRIDCDWVSNAHSKFKLLFQTDFSFFIASRSIMYLQSPDSLITFIFVWFLVIQTHVSVTSVGGVVARNRRHLYIRWILHSQTFVVLVVQFQKTSTAHKGELIRAQAKNNKPPVAAVRISLLTKCCYLIMF